MHVSPGEIKTMDTSTDFKQFVHRLLDLSQVMSGSFSGEPERPGQFGEVCNSRVALWPAFAARHPGLCEAGSRSDSEEHGSVFAGAGTAATSSPTPFILAISCKSVQSNWAAFFIRRRCLRFSCHAMFKRNTKLTQLHALRNYAIYM